MRGARVLFVTGARRFSTDENICISIIGFIRAARFGFRAGDVRFDFERSADAFRLETSDVARRS